MDKRKRIELMKMKREKEKMASQELLKFVPFSSCINPNFWFELNRMKLDEYKLDDYVQSYKNYYIGEKMYFAKYNYSETPHWLKEVIDAR